MKMIKPFLRCLGIWGLFGASLPLLLSKIVHYNDTRIIEKTSSYIDRLILERIMLMIWPSSILGLAEAPGNETEIYVYSIAGNVLLYMFIGAFIWLGIKKHKTLLVIPALTLVAIWWWAITLQ